MVHNKNTSIAKNAFIHVNSWIECLRDDVLSTVFLKITLWLIYFIFKITCN